MSLFLLGSFVGEGSMWCRSRCDGGVGMAMDRRDGRKGSDRIVPYRVRHRICLDSSSEYRANRRGARSMTNALGAVGRVGKMGWMEGDAGTAAAGSLFLFSAPQCPAPIE